MYIWSLVATCSYRNSRKLNPFRTQIWIMDWIGTKNSKNTINSKISMSLASEKSRLVINLTNLALTGNETDALISSSMETKISKRWRICRLGQTEQSADAKDVLSEGNHIYSLGKLSFLHQLPDITEIIGKKKTWSLTNISRKHQTYKVMNKVTVWIISYWPKIHVFCSFYTHFWGVPEDVLVVIFHVCHGG